MIAISDKEPVFHKLDNENQVFFYEQEFYVLSNFSSFNLRWKDKVFPTSEHAYHYEKFAHDENEIAKHVAHLIHRAPSAHEAFQIAQKNKGLRRQDWDDVKEGIMEEILTAKVFQHDYVLKKLMETGDRELIEDSWRDDYWGWGPNQDGQNRLGKLWMKVRETVRKHLPNLLNEPKVME